MKRAGLLLITCLAACGGAPAATSGPAKVDLPISDGLRRTAKTAGPKRESPPPSGRAKDSPFPAVARSKLANGLTLDVVTAKTLPIVQVRLVVKAGASYGAPPGVGELTADMLKDGGTRALTSADLLRRIETLGTNLSVRAETDATVLSLTFTKDKLTEGLGLLAQIVREPRFDEGELRKRKARATDEAADALRSSGAFTATWLVFHELYPTGSPYALHDLLPSDIAKIDGAQIRAFHKRFYVPSNAALVLAGDIEEAAAKELTQKNFGGWTGGTAPEVAFPPAKLPAKTRVIIAHRPKSVQSDVFIALLAPERKTSGWAAVRVANQVLGGGVASRLFSDVREQRSLAYNTRSQIIELARGEQPLVLYAGTETAKTAQAVLGLVENLDRMTSAPPGSAEIVDARRYLSDVFALRLETIGSIADMVTTQETFGLPLGYWDTYRKELRAVETPDTKPFTAAARLIVVAGDADVIAADLARYGEVTVVDAENELKPINKTVPAK